VADVVDGIAATAVGLSGVYVVGSDGTSAACRSADVSGGAVTTTDVIAAEGGAAAPGSVAPSEGGVGIATHGSAAPTGVNLASAGEVGAAARCCC
jgi:hypothetical protein